ncbi:hypothetical protein OSTOST_00656 [Ostertagia ostertagi]
MIGNVVPIKCDTSHSVNSSDGAYKGVHSSCWVTAAADGAGQRLSPKIAAADRICQTREQERCTGQLETNITSQVPHYEPPVKLSPKTCSALQCDFEGGSCLQTLDSSDWRIGEEPVGSRSSGIRTQLDGPFAYAIGPGTASLSLGPFEMSRSFAIEFCYYIASYRSKLVVYLSRTQESDRERKQSDIEFSAEGLRNEYSYLGLDQIDVYDPLLGVSACKKKSESGKFPLFL